MPEKRIQKNDNSVDKIHAVIQVFVTPGSTLFFEDGH